MAHTERRSPKSMTHSMTTHDPRMTHKKIFAQQSKNALHSGRAMSHVNRNSIMNKTETRETLNAARYAAAGFPDMAARTLSMLYRASLRASSKARLLQAARDIGVADHPEFII